MLGPALGAWATSRAWYTTPVAPMILGPMFFWYAVSRTTAVGCSVKVSILTSYCCGCLGALDASGAADGVALAAPSEGVVAGAVGVQPRYSDESKHAVAKR